MAIAHFDFLNGQVTLDMRVVCPQDVKEMLLRQASPGFFEEVDSQARVCGFERRSFAGSDPGYAAKTIFMKWKACCGRRLGVENDVRYLLGRRKEV